jgi:hypothetical protein
MFEKLFSKFKERKSLADKTSEEIEAEFEKIKVQYANLGTTDTYLILTEYFLAKIDINRDVMEQKDPLIEADRFEIVNRRAENRVMRGLIQDIEHMKQQVEVERL